MNEEDAQAGLGEPVVARATVRDWLREGARVAALRAPRWPGLQARPATLLSLVLAVYLLGCGMQWAVMEGSPQFIWQGLLGGWGAIAVLSWLCWVVLRSRGSDSVSLGQLVTMVWAASLVLSLALVPLELGLKAAYGASTAWPLSLQWAMWLLPLSWALAMELRLLWRLAGTMVARLAVLWLVPAHLLLNFWLAPIVFWWTPPAAEAGQETPREEASATPDRGLPLTEAVITAQPLLLADALAAVRPPEPGRVNVFALTYAPYASEDVFMRESTVVAKAMRERFSAGGRIVELVNNPATARRLPWAMPTHLHKAIQHMAAVMDRDRDVLFLHLTSHGGADGVLAADSWPLETGTMTPQLLKRWLDEAGVKWRVISISACYSGSWVAPLAGDGTLVMTAADADHTSYGCGRRSPLTFFGQAMYVDALYETRSFTTAHARARRLIEEREIQAGKKDGYSNPQIRVGEGIRPVLERLEQQQKGD